MPLSRSFKTDESFLEKIAIGATGTRQAFEDLRRNGHDPIELERGSMSFKIWKKIKIKRVRVPDILCLSCGLRTESRAKTKMEITMSHSPMSNERGWDFGLGSDDRIALIHCLRTGDGPLDWTASPMVQYVRVEPLRAAWQAGQVRVQQPKGAQEGFETRVTWPAAVATASGKVEEISEKVIKYRVNGRVRPAQLNRQNVQLQPLVRVGDELRANQIIAAVVPVDTEWPCRGGRDLGAYIELSNSTSLSDRYSATKALNHFPDQAATDAMIRRIDDPKEHIYVRVEAAAGLLRRGNRRGREFLRATISSEGWEERSESVIVLGEVDTPESTQLLINTLQDPDQNSEIRAGAAWSLGEAGAHAALPALVQSFNSLETVIKIEAARALAKVARGHLDYVLQALPNSSSTERPGIAWSLGKAGGFSLDQLIPALVDDDARQWVAYILGTQDPEEMLPTIEALAAEDPEVYFAVTVLWKVIASWIYGLEEY